MYSHLYHGLVHCNARFRFHLSVRQRVGETCKWKHKKFIFVLLISFYLLLLTFTNIVFGMVILNTIFFVVFFQVFFEVRTQIGKTKRLNWFHWQNVKGLIFRLILNKIYIKIPSRYFAIIYALLNSLDLQYKFLSCVVHQNKMNYAMSAFTSAYP